MTLRTLSGALTATLTLAFTATMAVPAAAAPVTDLHVDFADGSLGALQQSGDPTFSYVEDPDDSSNQVLRVQGREFDYDGVSTVAGLLDADTTYTVSARVRLAPGVDPAAMKLVSTDGYATIGTEETVTADAWVTLTGTVTPSVADARVYLGSGASTPSIYDYLVDDVTITHDDGGTGGGTDGTCEAVESVDFEDASAAPWSANNATVTVVEDSADAANHVGAVTGRTDTWQGIQSPVGAYEEGVEYLFEAKVRLSATASVRFVANEPGQPEGSQYVWVGNQDGVTAGEWTTISGTHTFGADAANAKVSIEVSTTQDYEVDDIAVTPADCDGSGGGTGGSSIVIPEGFVPGGAEAPTSSPVAAAQAPATGDGYYAALTFDDGPNPPATNAILDFLEANDLNAVFCVIGQNIQTEAQIATLKRIVADGNMLCNHSTSYAAMDSMSDQAVADDLIENLEIIRDALGDPQAEVPFFRAPNGAWGGTGRVAKQLGMQPLAVINTISDWDASLTQEQITANLEAAISPATSGQVILTHDGGGDRTKTVNAVTQVVADRLSDGWQFTFPEAAGAPDPEGPAPEPGTILLETSFEDGLDGWFAREGGETDHTVATTTDFAADGAQSAAVTDRDHQGDGLAIDVSDILVPQTTVELTAWLRMAPGQPAGPIWLTLERTSGGSASYDTLAQFTGITNSGWTQVSARFTPAAFDSAVMYFETAYDAGNAGNTSDFYVDAVRAQVPEPAQIQDLTPIKDTQPFPVGVAIDSRETTGAASQLLLRHFNQVTPENHMKPEAWYTAEGDFQPAADADAIMAFARDHDLDVYGHVLVWHSQTPAWFFEDASGTPLTDSAADQEILKDRMREHIFAVAGYLADQYGPFGSATNPLNAFDVVNEVISDSGEYADGMRRSEWYRILGEQFVDYAFLYANEAFNDTYADASADHPVELFINDYNTEQTGKRVRYHDLIERLLARDVPIDGVGHQFHLNLAFPVENLDDTLNDFEGLGLRQAVTEFDVTTGTPESEAKFVDQGYYYQRAFEIFREHADDLRSVTVWGLTDGRSWRDSSGGPLVFDDELQAKPAYTGIVDGALEAPLRSATSFQGEVALEGGAASATWDRLPLLQAGSDASFQTRWSPDRLTVLVRVADDAAAAGDGVRLLLGDGDVWIARDGSGTADAVVTERADGYDVVAHLPLSGAVEGDTLQFDVRATVGGETEGWNAEGVQGTLTLVEPLSFVQTPEAATAPVIDGTVDAAWADAPVITTDKEVSGTGGAVGAFRTLWSGQTLYVLGEVTDPTVDTTGSDPWTQDSVEIYVDPGNAKNGSYRYDDTQIRISADGVVSFGTGDEGFQAGRLSSAVSRTETGYTVEAAISLLEYGGEGSFHGLDVQVNDATGGARDTIRNWADPTGAGYQSTARWGVTELVAAGAVDPGDGGGNGGGDGSGNGNGGNGGNGGNSGGNPNPGGHGNGTPGANGNAGGNGNGPLSVEQVREQPRGGISAPSSAAPGETITIQVGRDYAGQKTQVVIYSEPQIIGAPVVDANGEIQATIPADLPEGTHTLAVYDADGDLIGWTSIEVVAADGSLSGTGPADYSVALLVALVMALAGATMVLRRAQ